MTRQQTIITCHKTSRKPERCEVALGPASQCDVVYAACKVFEDCGFRRVVHFRICVCVCVVCVGVGVGVCVCVCVLCVCVCCVCVCCVCVCCVCVLCVCVCLSVCVFVFSGGAIKQCKLQARRSQHATRRQFGQDFGLRWHDSYTLQRLDPELSMLQSLDPATSCSLPVHPELGISVHHCRFLCMLIATVLKPLRCVSQAALCWLLSPSSKYVTNTDIWP